MSSIKKTNSEYAYSIKKALKDLGHEVPITHCHEVIARTEGFRSLNHALGSKTFNPEPDVDVDNSMKMHTAGDPSKVVEKQLAEIKKIADEGLNEVYDSVSDWLYDFYPDFSWTYEGSFVEIEALLNHPQFEEVAKKFEEVHDFNIKDELKGAIKERELYIEGEKQ